MTKHYLDLHYVDELKNFVANNLLSWCLKSRTGIRATNCHYRTSPIGYWGKGSTIGWYKVLGFLYL